MDKQAILDEKLENIGLSVIQKFAVINILEQILTAQEEESDIDKALCWIGRYQDYACSYQDREWNTANLIKHWIADPDRSPPLPTLPKEGEE